MRCLPGSDTWLVDVNRCFYIMVVNVSDCMLRPQKLRIRMLLDGWHCRKRLHYTEGAVDRWFAGCKCGQECTRNGVIFEISQCLDHQTRHTNKTVAQIHSAHCTPRLTTRQFSRLASLNGNHAGLAFPLRLHGQGLICSDCRRADLVRLSVLGHELSALGSKHVDQKPNTRWRFR